MSELDDVPFMGSMPGAWVRASLDKVQRAGADVQLVVETPLRDALVLWCCRETARRPCPKGSATEAGRHGAVILPSRPRCRNDVVLAHRDRPFKAFRLRPSAGRS